MMSPKTILKLVLLIMVLTICTATANVDLSNVDLSPFRGKDNKLLYINFDISTESFESFFRRLRELIRMYSTIMLDHRILLPDQSKLPYIWILVGLSCGGQHKSAILLRGDNLYQVGFMNSLGHLYTFEKYSNDILPGSTYIGLGVQYGKLIKGGIKQLHTIPLGKTSAQYSCSNMSSYDPTSSNEDHIKITILQNILMYSETQRFFAVHWKVSQGWEGTCFLSRDEASLLVVWKEISEAILEWFMTGRWNATFIRESIRNKFRIFSKGVASGIVDVVIRPKWA